MPEILNVETALVVVWVAGFVFACFAFAVGELIHLVSTYISCKLKGHRDHFDCKLCSCRYYGSADCFDSEYVPVEGRPMVCRCKNYTPQEKK